ncbi:MAG: dTMP kinase, partial [Anaerolineales bacterium]
RFFDSSLAYQGYGHQLNLQTLWTVTTFATQGLIPDRTYLLDVPVEVGIERRKQDGNWNRLDAFDLDLHKRVRSGYLQLAEDDKGRWEILDASQPFDEVQESLRQSALKLIGSRGLLKGS